MTDQTRMPDQTLSEFTAQLASAQPAPGGGSAAALTGALAVSLAAMAANVTAANPRYADRTDALAALAAACDAQRAALLALYHEAPEVITGDLATPIKYFNPGIRSAYKEIEGLAAKKLHAMLPEDLQGDYAPLLLRPEEDPEWKRVKAADKISAYVKCVEELRAGNDEFTRAGESILSQIEAMDLPEARAFLAEFLPSFRLTMDELN